MPERRPSIELDSIDLNDISDARCNVAAGTNAGGYDNIDADVEDNREDDEGSSASGMDIATDIATAESELRVILINKPQPQKYCTNSISTGKYNIFTFIPKFLFEQFRKWANIFFLFIALMQQIPDVSPTGRYTTLVPLIFIFSVSAIKEIIEDVKRHRADDETNHRITYVLRDNTWKEIRWRDIVVGDIVRVNNNGFFPADLVLLSSSEPQAMSFIETANLDGETNLKIRQGLASTGRLTDTQELLMFSGSLQCEPPNRHLYEFKGVLKELDKLPEYLGPDQIMLRGATLRNTSWIFGLVIYTGHETKLMKNTTLAPLKRSTVDKLTNTQVLMLFGILLFMCIVCAICNEFWMLNHADTDWYIGLTGIAYKNVAFNFLTFIILFNNLIPISLQVTLEVVRFVQAIFINMDAQMYHAETDTPAMARTSNLNEELGQVKYIFSDKTGTLTRNIMEFKKLAVGSDVYCAAPTPEESLFVQNIKNKHKNADILHEIMVLFAVCHTVIPEKKSDGTISYHAASPDERALVAGACKFGYKFETRTPNVVEIDILGVKEQYEILNVLEFNSTRKRMSVIVKDSQERIRLFCKGADSVIYERLAANGRQYSEEILMALEHFAVEGLRTLCFAVSDIKPAAYITWQELYQNASVDLENREQKLDEVANKIEKDLRLLGASAVEDKLQEGVPETIEALLKANINMWVLTGDKQETAVNIGYSCKLIMRGMPLITLNEDSLDNTRDSIQRHSAELGDQLNQSNDIALIVDGKTLKYALSHDLQSDFIQLCVSCKVVICCRVSPMQKAEVVDLVTRHTKEITLAIGDGANDVAMIQKAHVGVGISGIEGLQAACASDYSIAQFRFLLRLLLVHGSWNYSRLCKLILYSFYKNICLYVIELWFAIYSGWSGQILFERWSIGLYNVMFTALPPLAMGLFDRACSADTMLKFPELYKPSQDAKLFNVKVFWMWIVNALFHSALLYWLTLLLCEKDVLWSHGKGGGYLVMGNFVYTYVVVTVCFKAGLVTNSWNVLTHCAIWGSILMWFLFIFIYSNVWPHINVGAIMLGMDRMLGTCPIFWLGLMIIPFATVIPDLVFLVIKNTLFKSTADKARESEIRKSDPSEVFHTETKQSLSETARLLKNVRNVFRLSQSRYDVVDFEMSHGFAFSQEEGASVTQTDIIRAYDTTIPKPDGE